MKWMIPIAGLLALISSSAATVVEDVQSVSFLDCVCAVLTEVSLV